MKGKIRSRSTLEFTDIGMNINTRSVCFETAAPDWSIYVVTWSQLRGGEVCKLPSDWSIATAAMLFCEIANLSVIGRLGMRMKKMVDFTCFLF